MIARMLLGGLAGLIVGCVLVVVVVVTLDVPVMLAPLVGEAIGGGFTVAGLLVGLWVDTRAR